MKRTLLVVLLLVGAAAADTKILIWHPGAGGSAADAEPFLAELARYLEGAAGLEEGAVEIVYAADEKDGLAFIEGHQPDLLIVSLPVYVKYARAYGWVAKLEAKRILQPEGRYVTALADSEAGSMPPIGEIVPEDLPSQAKFYGTELWDPRFVGLFLNPAEGAEFAQTRRTSTAIRKAQKEGAGIILSEKDYSGIRENVVGFRAVYVSEAMPVDLVVVREGSDCLVLLDALAGMNEDANAANLRETLDLKAFVPVDVEELRAAVERY